NLSKLVKRDDYRPRLPPWAIFRVSPKKFEDYRIAWQEIAKHFEACILPVDVPVEICGKQVSRKLVPDVTIYFIAEENPRKALRLLLYLNSDLARSLLKLRAWPSRGGYFRHESASVGFLPVPAGLLKRGVWDWVEEPPAQTAGELNEHARKVYEENKERLEKELAESLGLTDEEYRAVVDWGKWLNES
ncbi:MAG: hypothetical protein N3E43_06680, partial [Sulfolobales archaeon]|nr:hypothetical protein [Sulfolobales archaeon]